MKKVKNKVSKVVVDRDLCIGAAPCIAVAPYAFDLDDNGIAIVKKSWKKHTDDDLIIAAQSCPVQAIFLYDKEGKQIFP
jgi:ferredoxin